MSLYGICIDSTSLNFAVIFLRQDYFGNHRAINTTVRTALYDNKILNN